jgi:hypothetical protein
VTKVGGVGAKLVSVVTALEEADVPYAVGGALALGFHAEPRGTQDIDINVFLAPESGPRVLQLLQTVGLGVDHVQNADEVVVRTGQIRTLYEGTYVDLFFAHHPFFESAAASVATAIPGPGAQYPFGRGPDRLQGTLQPASRLV